MRSRTRALFLFVAALVLLRQGIAFVDAHLESRRMQAVAIEEHAIDPRALFYAESRVALAAEKEFRRKLK